VVERNHAESVVSLDVRPEEFFDEVVDVPPGVPAENADRRIQASEFLEKAGKLLLDRGEVYDSTDGERSASATVAAFNAITKHDLTEAEGYLFLQILKDVRQWQCDKFHQDSAEDAIAYAALKAEALARE